MIQKLISGFQNGADIGGIKAAIKFEIPTEGNIPNGYRTLDGPRPEYGHRFGAKEHISPSYPPRTELNVLESDGTIRFASDFNSAGELCTLKFIKKHNKPYFDISIKNPLVHMVPKLMAPKYCIEWIINNNIKILNVAGNSEKTCPNIEEFVVSYLSKVFEGLKNV